MFAAQAAAKGTELRIEPNPESPPWLLGDGGKVKQVLINLVSNAVKFTDVGSVTVEASVLRHTPSSPTVRIAVTDTGIGIASDRQAGIFESFEQGNESTNRVYGGTGLGLSICRQLVALMRGRVGLESAPGRGSTFWIELPMESVTPLTGAADAA
jgi:signal transduction histidine kinase